MAIIDNRSRVWQIQYLGSAADVNTNPVQPGGGGGSNLQSGSYDSARQVLILVSDQGDRIEIDLDALLNKTEAATTYRNRTVAIAESDLTAALVNKINTTVNPVVLSAHDEYVLQQFALTSASMGGIEVLGSRPIVTLTLPPDSRESTSSHFGTIPAGSPTPNGILWRGDSRVVVSFDTSGFSLSDIQVITTINFWLGHARYQGHVTSWDASGGNYTSNQMYILGMVQAIKQVSSQNPMRIELMSAGGSAGVYNTQVTFAYDDIVPTDAMNEAFVEDDSINYTGSASLPANNRAANYNQVTRAMRDLYNLIQGSTITTTTVFLFARDSNAVPTTIPADANSADGNQQVTIDIPTLTQNSYLFLAQAQTDADFTNISIAGFSQISTWEKGTSTFTYNGVVYEYWVTINLVAQNVTGSITVTR